ncbi:MAG: ATP-binding cassette domain-containing protein [Candidatus Sumerlaeia bacterium]
MGGALIELDKISVRFGEQQVLEDFSLVLHERECLVLTGRSGSGKSTVLRCILGFVRPDSGTIRIDGEVLNGHSVWSLRRKMAFVDQEPDLGDGNVEDAIHRPFDFRANHDRRQRLEKIKPFMDRLLLPHSLLDKEVSELSGGEKQRVGILIAMLLGRSIFLLDEASSALDAESREAAADWFQEQDDISILSISHDENPFPAADRVIHVTNGAGGEASDE